MRGSLAHQLPDRRSAKSAPHCIEELENDWLKFQRANKYQYGSEFITVANPSSRSLGAVNVGSMLEHCEKKRFLKDNFSLADVDGEYHHLRTLKLATSERAGTE